MRCRFAPSPTGYMHLGNVWTALLCWLQARRGGGTLVLRIEDIDEGRSKKEYTRALMEDLTFLGLDRDEGPDAGWPYGPYRQQERYNLYEAAIERLKRLNLVYPCYCSRARITSVSGAPHEGELSVYDGRCYGLTEAERRRQRKKPSLRLHVPERSISFTDGLYGLQEEYLPTKCGDFVIRRADGMYAYQLAVTVDDGAMGITHVLRGRDLLGSTGRQILLSSYLGYQTPKYTHVPLLIDCAGHRLSKRQHGITVRELRAEGITGRQILSYLAYKGGLVREACLYDPDRLVQQFDIRNIGVKDIVIDADHIEAIKYFGH